MGQVSSRLIRYISMDLTISGPGNETLPKALRLLASRARSGALRVVDLDVDIKEYQEIAAARNSESFKKQALYDNLLVALRFAAQEAKFEKNMHVTIPVRWTRGRHVNPDVLRELHLAWSPGRLFVNEVLLYEDYEIVEGARERLCMRNEGV